jgi:hypothetical protein
LMGQQGNKDDEHTRPAGIDEHRADRGEGSCCCCLLLGVPCIVLPSYRPAALLCRSAALLCCPAALLPCFAALLPCCPALPSSCLLCRQAALLCCPSATRRRASSTPTSYAYAYFLKLCLRPASGFRLAMLATRCAVVPALKAAPGLHGSSPQGSSRAAWFQPSSVVMAQGSALVGLDASNPSCPSALAVLVSRPNRFDLIVLGNLTLDPNRLDSFRVSVVLVPRFRIP